MIKLDTHMHPTPYADAVTEKCHLKIKMIFQKATVSLA